MRVDDKVVCKSCSKKFLVKPSQIKYGWGRFCSRMCTHKAQTNGKLFKCYVCHKEIYKSISEQNHSKSHKFFCSKVCQTNWRNKLFSGKKHPNWKGGVGIYRETLTKNTTDRFCRICKLADSRVLIVHHIDHNRGNNKIPNLSGFV